MKLISFALTTPQFLDGSKTVTRRSNWLKLKAGDRLMAVNKSMGFRKGESPTRYGVIEIVDVRRERLDAITDDDCAREGFSQYNAAEFVRFYCKHAGGFPEMMVTRIEFRRLPPLNITGDLL